MKKLVGSYFLGHETVNLYATDQSQDGEAHIPGDWEQRGKLSTGEIVVGMKKLSWPCVVDNLLHEAFEYAAIKEHCRFNEEITVNQNPAHGLFVMTHEQFTQIAAMVANFIAPALPELAKIYARLPKKNKPR